MADVLGDWSILAKATVFIVVCALVVSVVLAVVLWAPASPGRQPGLTTSLAPIGVAGAGGLFAIFRAWRGRGPRR